MGLRVIENHVTTNALNLSCPFRAFIARAFDNPGLRKPSPRAMESGPYRAENVACRPRRALRGPRFPRRVGLGIDPCPRPTVISPAPTGRDPIAQVAAQRGLGIRGRQWPTPSIYPQPQRGVIMGGRDNGRPEFDNQGATHALALSRPVRAFVGSRVRQPGAAPRALESGPYRAENIAPVSGFFSPKGARSYSLGRSAAQA